MCYNLNINLYKRYLLWAIYLNIFKIFPNKQLKIINISEDAKIIRINLKSQTNTCRCPRCNTISNKYHGTYVRKVRDLPILGK